MFYKFFIIATSAATLIISSQTYADSTIKTPSLYHSGSSMLLAKHNKAKHVRRHIKKQKHKKFNNKPWTAESSPPWAWGKRDGWQELSPADRAALKAEQWTNWKSNLKEQVLSLPD